MLKGNEYGGIELVALDSSSHSRHCAHDIISSMIQDSIENLDVRPPTSESLTASVQKGIEVGRELYKQGFGESAVTAGLAMAVTESFFAWPTNDNASSFRVAAEEAFRASEFRFLSADFDNPLDADKGVRPYSQVVKEA